MMAWTVIGFIIINLLGIAFLPRLTAMIYVTYSLAKWGYFESSFEPSGTVLVFLVIAMVVAFIMDCAQVGAWFGD